MARSARWTFGPGSLESVEVKLWAVNGTYGEQMKAKVSGTYRVYCGNGSEHLVPFSETATAWRAQRKDFDTAELLWALTEQRDTASAERLARVLIDWALESWDDPCEESAHRPE